MTNEERIARLEKIIQEARSKKDELEAENSQESDVEKWERELDMQTESSELASKGKTGSGF